jgi:hypothetical protein
MKSILEIQQVTGLNLLLPGYRLASQYIFVVTQSFKNIQIVISLKVITDHFKYES